MQKKQGWKSIAQVNEKCCVWKDNVKIVSNKKVYLKWVSKPSHKKYLTMFQLRYVKVELHERLTNQHMRACAYQI